MRNPVNLDLYANRNAGFSTSFVLVEDGAPLDLTDMVPTLQIRVQPGQTGTPILEANTVSGLAIRDAVGGVLAFNIAASTLGAFPANLDPFAALTLYYDLRLVPSGGIAFIPVQGRFFLSAGVTR